MDIEELLEQIEATARLHITDEETLKAFMADIERVLRNW